MNTQTGSTKRDRVKRILDVFHNISMLGRTWLVKKWT